MNTHSQIPYLHQITIVIGDGASNDAGDDVDDGVADDVSNSADDDVSDGGDDVGDDAGDDGDGVAEVMNVVTRRGHPGAASSA